MKIEIHAYVIITSPIPKREFRELRKVSTRNVHSAAELCALVSDIQEHFLPRYFWIQVNINTSLASLKETVSNHEELCNLFAKIWKEYRFQDNDWQED